MRGDESRRAVKVEDGAGIILEFANAAPVARTSTAPSRPAIFFHTMPTNRTNDGAPLRIAVTVDPDIPVPPTLYGGIERIVDFLVRELVGRGHDVTLIA